MYLLRQIVGFLLQLMPCLLLFRTAFLPEQYRWNYHWFHIISDGAIVLESTGFALLMATVRQNASAVLFYSNTFMAVTLIALAILYLFAIYAPIVHKILSLCVSVTYGVAIYFLMNFILDLLWLKDPWVDNGFDLYMPHVILILALLTALTLPPMLLFVYRLLRSHLSQVENKLIWRSVRILSIITTLYLVCTSFCELYDVSFASANVVMIRFAVFLFSTVCIAAVYWVLFWEIDQLNARQDAKQINDILHLQYKSLCDEINATRKQRHDARQQNHVLEQLLRSGAYEQALQQLQIGQAQLDRSEQRYFCKEPAINALLQYYDGQVQSAGITLEVLINAPIQDNMSADLTILLGNLLENALRSCTKSDIRPAHIRLNADEMMGIFAIYMENTCSAVRQVPFIKSDEDGYLCAEAFQSTKAQTVQRGYGLKSISALAKKYKGSALFRYEGQTFYSKILLYTDCSN